MVAKIAEANNVLKRRLRRKPTYNEIAEVLNVNVSTVKLVSERSRQPISLDRSITDQSNLILKVRQFNSYFRRLTINYKL